MSIHEAERHLRAAIDGGNPGCDRTDLLAAWMTVRRLIKPVNVIDVEFKPVPRFEPATRRQLENW